MVLVIHLRITSASVVFDNNKIKLFCFSFCFVMSMLAATLGSAAIEEGTGLIKPVIQNALMRSNINWLADSVGMKPGEFALASSGANPSIIQYQGSGTYTSHKAYGVEPTLQNMIRFPGATRPMR